MNREQIAREIDFADSYMQTHDDCDAETHRALQEAIEILKQEPKIGHWIDGHCSECGCDVPAYIVDWRWIKDMDAKYCPQCGARMESEG